jgi:hypothetical protein
MSFVVRPHEDVARGHGAFARPGGIKTGEVVLSEPPLLVYPQASVAHLFCGHCLHYLVDRPATAETCPCCRLTRFCSESCRAAAASDPASHSPMACAIMQSACVKDATDETVSALHFLSRLYALLAGSRAGDGGALRRYEAFLSLSDGNRDVILEDHEYAGWLEEVCHRFAPCLARIEEGALGPPGQLPEATPSFVKMACLKDLVNSYGIRVPLALGVDCGVLRGTALYEEAARINHECLPNVARCEDFDQSTSMKFVALHDLPEGEEITQSYFPLDWGVSDRQTRCRTVYGFTCTCPRCALEGDGGEAEHLQGVDDGYIAVFLLKYLCMDNACEGTMVPVLGSANGTHMCNVCGRSRTNAEFMRGLES